MTHVAYNLVTGEIITTNHSRHLNRLVARTNRWNIANGYPTGKWVFVHKAEWRYPLLAKMGLA